MYLLFCFFVRLYENHHILYSALHLNTSYRILEYAYLYGIWCILIFSFFIENIETHMSIDIKTRFKKPTSKTKQYKITCYRFNLIDLLRKYYMNINKILCKYYLTIGLKSGNYVWN